MTARDKAIEAIMVAHHGFVLGGPSSPMVGGVYSRATAETFRGEFRERCAAAVDAIVEAVAERLREPPMSGRAMVANARTMREASENLHKEKPHGDAPGESLAPAVANAGSPTTEPFASLTPNAGHSEELPQRVTAGRDQHRPFFPFPDAQFADAAVDLAPLTAQALAEFVRLETLLPGARWHGCGAKDGRCDCGLIWLTENFGLALADDDQRAYPKISATLIAMRNALPSLLAEVTKSRTECMDVEGAIRDAERRGFMKAVQALENASKSARIRTIGDAWAVILRNAESLLDTKEPPRAE